MLLSIITINYNDAHGLKKTMESVLEQTYQDLEYIVIDGGSTDGSKALIEQHNSKLSYWVSEPDNGIYSAMNKGIKEAKGDYVLFLNSGDTLVSNTIINKVISNVIQDKAIYYGDLCYGDSENSKMKTYPEKLTFKYFYQGGYIPHPASFIKRELFTTVGLYDENYKIISDWKFFIKAICKYNVSYQYFNEAVTYYDVNGISANSALNIVKAKEKQLCYLNDFSAFIDDYKMYTRMENRLSLNRFKYLTYLEGNKIAQKLNSAWLLVLSKVF